MCKVILRQEKITIPTYEIAAYDKNPMFLDKRVYQGSSGRVYPHPVCEKVADVKTDKEYDAVFLENDYLEVMILPQIGGRIQRILDKTNGYDAVYYNEVIKPALVGLAGPWISGGIEFNWPQHHRPSTYDPVDINITKKEDGSVTVWVGETEKMFHTRGMAGYTLYPDKAYLEITGKVYNPTDRPQTFLWWANPAVAVNEYTRSIFPPDVHAVMDHGKRAVSKFPIADGEYYKVDYSPGTDISRYKNIPVPTSYMAYHSDFDFIGNYDDSKQAGLLHVADHHISPGKKQWTWGNGDFGQAWDRSLTDENGPYIELMTGVFTDNQPDFTFLKPYEEKTFVQYFMPYKGVGAVKNASVRIVLNAEMTENGLKCILYAPEALKDARLQILLREDTAYAEEFSLAAAEVYEREIRPEELGCTKKQLEEAMEMPGAFKIAVLKDGKEILGYTPVKNSEPVPEAASEIPEPEKLKSNEQLFLAAVHLEQYRHATYSPEPYYLEGLRRDPADIRLNNGYGKYLYNKGRYEEAVCFFKAAIASSTWKNPNPYDCEPYYNLGLALRATGEEAAAYDAFYKATWDGAQQDKAFYHLACMEATRQNFEAALSFVEKSLSKGRYNMEARTLKTALLRHLGRKEEAIAYTLRTMEADALEHGSRYEYYRLTGKDRECFASLMRGDNHNYIELALTYINAGLLEDADHILTLAPIEDEPMVHYYRFFCSGNMQELEKAEKSSALYCFPNRIQDISVLRHAIGKGAVMANYYLGNLFYDKGRFEEATALWERCAGQIDFPTVYRNLALAYYNKWGEEKKAQAAMEKAFALDQTDARVFFELDQLYKMLNVPVQVRLEKMKEQKELLETRDDLYTEYITLLNLTGAYEEAYRCISTHSFHPWEGGEGKISAQYRNALMKLAEDREASGAGKEAVMLLEQALIYPHNLGEGKLIGNLDNDIYYKLGMLYEEEVQKKEAFLKAARGGFALSSAMYYNDQPPEMMYYAALALKALGKDAEAEQRFDRFIEYAAEHMEDEKKIDYFAVSLPDFLIFDADLNKKNKVHCIFMEALGYLGKGELSKARELAQKGLALEDCHAGFRDIMRS